LHREQVMPHCGRPVFRLSSAAFQMASELVFTTDRGPARVMSMAQVKAVKPRDIARYLKAVRQLIRLPAQQMWTDYDEGADVLYLSFRKPQRATDSVMRDDGIIVRTCGKEIVGLTILDASTR